MNTLQSRLIRKAYEKCGIVHPIHGMDFSEKHFTEHKDKDGIKWLFFWFNDIDLSSRIVRIKKDNNE